VDAACAQATRLMYESLHPCVVPQIIADTMQHMIRLDLVVLMQVRCGSPVWLTLWPTNLAEH
jgi:hypothetical protein